MGTPNPKIIKSGVVHLLSDAGEYITLAAGDVVPDWADSLVTNPALFEGGESESTETSTETTPPPVNSGDSGGQSTETPSAPVKQPSQAELKAQAKQLGLPTGGSKKELAERIAAKQAELAPVITEGTPSGEPASGDDEDGDRAALEDKAKELGIEFDRENTDDELAALIEDAQE
ncbi:SAP domain-containing protein [Microbacterium trichothecenolyticum]|uniref:SAP domain protein n=1 Tax=Microbacterium trichothecenolyticum TaxID=69370 RepID=A0A0M2H758_MICTR|nr:SAP domain-containing protein [Microbacterium trichothecenolyticum]KJL39913.1 SAP domain protein [Microbacterium trichothecenolyticum]